MLSINEQSKLVFWSGTQVPRITLTEYNVIAYLASAPGAFFSCRQIYDVMKGIPGFQAGDGLRGVHSNVRSAIKRIRKKFLSLDPGFDAIICYTAFGYGWKEGMVAGKRCCPTCGQVIVQSKDITIPVSLNASVVIPEQDNLQ